MHSMSIENISQKIEVRTFDYTAYTRGCYASSPVGRNLTVPPRTYTATLGCDSGCTLGIMPRTRRRRGTLHAVVTAALFLKPTVIMAWSIPASVCTSSTTCRSSLSSSRDCNGLCGAVPLRQQLASSKPMSMKRRRHRVSLVGRARAQSSGGLQELENLRAAAEVDGRQQRQQTANKPTTPERDSSARKRSRGVGGKGGDGHSGGKGTKRKLQSVDFTTALVMSRELAQVVVPARVENAYQLDPYNLAIGLRTLEGNLWLHVSWHPQVRLFLPNG